MNKSGLANKVKNVVRDEKSGGSGVKKLGDAQKSSSTRKVTTTGSKESGSKD